MKPDILNPTGRNHVIVATSTGVYRCRGCALKTWRLQDVAAHVVAFQYNHIEEPPK